MPICIIASLRDAFLTKETETALYNGFSGTHFVHRQECRTRDGVFIYALSADETSPALAALRHAITALFSCRFKRPCPPRRQRQFHGNADRAYNTLYFASTVVCQMGALPPLETPTRKGGTLPLYGAHTAFSCYPALRLYRLSKSQRGIDVVSLTLGNSVLPIGYSLPCNMQQPCQMFLGHLFLFSQVPYIFPYAAHHDSSRHTVLCIKHTTECLVWSRNNSLQDRNSHYFTPDFIV